MREVDLSFSKLGYHDGCIFLEKVLITHPELFPSKIGIDLVEFNPLKMNKKESFIQLHHPRIDIDLTSQQNSLAPVNFFELCKSLESFSELSIYQGGVNILTKNLTFSFLFSFIPSEKIGHLGTIHLKLDSDAQANAKIEVSHYDENIRLDINILDSDLPAYSNLFDPFKLLDRGKIKGLFECEINPQGKMVKAAHCLEANKVHTLYNEKIDIYAETIYLSGGFENISGIQLETLTSNDLLECLRPSLKMQGVDVAVLNEDVSVYLAQNINYELSLLQQGQIYCSTQGELDENHRFAFDGEGQFHFLNEWSLSMKVNEKISKIGALPAFSLKKQKGLPLAFFLDIDQLQVEKIEDLKKTFFPATAPFLEFKQGFLSSKLTLFFEKEGIKKINVDEFSLEKTQVNSLQYQVFFNIEAFKGQGAFDFPFSLSSESSFAIDFSRCQCNLDCFGIKNMTLSGLIHYKQGSFSDSMIYIDGEGVHLETLLHGSFDEMHSFFHLELLDHHPYMGLQEKILQKGDSLEPIKSCQGKMTLKKEETQYKITSFFELFFPSSSDTIEADFFFDRRLSFHHAEFKSERVSPSTYLWFLEYYQQKWYVLGQMSVQGKLDSNTLFFQLQTDQAFFDSEDITVFIEQSHFLHEGDFSFDLNLKKWLIHLPIKQARCVDKKLKLPFEDVKTHVTIDGTVLTASDLVASCEGVQCQGRLIVDFSDRNWTDLKLYPSIMQGSFKEFLCFLSYIPGLESAQTLSSIEGKIEGDQENYFFIRYNDDSSEKQAKIQLKAQEVSIDIPSRCSLKEGSFLLHWDLGHQLLEIKDLKGICSIGGVNETKEELIFSAPQLFSKNLSQDEWEFDLRLEKATHDVIRLAGKTGRENHEIKIDFDPQINQCFGANIEMIQCIIDDQGYLKRSKGIIQATLSQAVNMMQFCEKLGLFPCNRKTIEEFFSDKKEGTLRIDLDYIGIEDQLIIDLKCLDLSLKNIAIPSLEAHLIKRSNRWSLSKLKTDSMDVQGEIYLTQEHQWKISSVEACYKNSYLIIKKGFYDADQITLSDVNSTLDLQDILFLMPKHDTSPLWCRGKIDLKGDIDVDVSKGFEQLRAKITGSIASDTFSQGALSIDPDSSYEMEYSLDQGCVLKQVHIQINKEQKEHLWLSAQIRNMELSSCFKIEGLHATIPPEMLLFLSSQGLIPEVKHYNNLFHIQNFSFGWDNQLEIFSDCFLDSNGWHIQLALKEGYYWISEKSVWVEHFALTYHHHQFNFLCGIDHLGLSLDFSVKYDLKEQGSFYITCKDRKSQEEGPSLEIVCKYLEQEGFVIQTAEGSIHGLEISIRKNSRAYGADRMMLTGQIKINTVELFEALPDLVGPSIKNLQIGFGYELSGDWIIHKSQLDQSCFKGFLKGRDFLLLGYEFKTLLSQIEITSTAVTIQEFCLSDLSGVLKVNEIKIFKDNDDAWHIHIPDLAIHDFRPSRMKKQDGFEEKLKPFIIKELHFGMIEGVLGQISSFRGKGNMEFVNTFKTEMNIFDIPIEILGRIGFDPGMFVPVIGKLEFEMKEGRIHLKELKNTYSEGKRSKFYLSGYKDSYVTLDGQVFIDIKMKQYVLLKITEPLTLSIRGTLAKPRYSLH